MNLKLKKAVTIIVLICFIGISLFSVVAPFFVHAAPSQSDITNVQNKKNDAKKKMDDASREKQDALNRKSAIEKNIEALQPEIDSLQADIDSADKKIAQKEKELAEAEQKAQNQYDAMKIRLRTMYEDNSSSYITLLFSGDNLTDMLSTAELIKQLLDYDNNMYDNFVATKNNIANAKKELEDEKATYKKKQGTLLAKQGELQGLKNDLSNTISSLTTDIETYKKAYAEFERQEATLKAQIANTVNNSSSGGAKYSGGQLAWPAPGYTYITSPYGYRVHPTLKVYKLHTGFDIAAPMNATVVAAEDGRVVTATYSSAYGNYIVINHGNGLSTLYAHNTTLLVSVGAQVSRGQTIAKVGSTGFSTGPHLHFEVLKNGTCTDPAKYF